MKMKNWSLTTSCFGKMELNSPTRQSSEGKENILNLHCSVFISKHGKNVWKYIQPENPEWSPEGLLGINTDNFPSTPAEENLVFHWIFSVGGENRGEYSLGRTCPPYTVAQAYYPGKVILISPTNDWNLTKQEATFISRANLMPTFINGLQKTISERTRSLIFVQWTH